MPKSIELVTFLSHDQPLDVISDHMQECSHCFTSLDEAKKMVGTTEPLQVVTVTITVTDNIVQLTEEEVEQGKRDFEANQAKKKNEIVDSIINNIAQSLGIDPAAIAVINTADLGGPDEQAQTDKPTLN